MSIAFDMTRSSVPNKTMSNAQLLERSKAHAQHPDFVSPEIYNGNFLREIEDFTQTFQPFAKFNLHEAWQHMRQHIERNE